MTIIPFFDTCRFCGSIKFLPRPFPVKGFAMQCADCGEWTVFKHGPDSDDA